MIGADLVRAARLLHAAVREQPGRDRRARGRRRPRDRLLPAGGLRRRAEPRLRRGAARARTRSCRRWRTSAGRSARCSAACSPPRRARTLAYWINARVVPRLRRARLAHPGAHAAERAGAHRGHWRDLGDGFRRPALAAAARRPRRVGHRDARHRASNVAEIFLAKNTFHAGDFGYGLLSARSASGSSSASFCGSALARAARHRADVRRSRSC